MAHRKGLHFTFIETRFSMESARKQELLSDIRRKHTLIVKHAVSRLRDALCKDNGGECLEYKWNFVYALYREHDTVKQDNGKRLPPNTILLNRGALNHFYGPSLSGLGML